MEEDTKEKFTCPHCKKTGEKIVKNRFGTTFRAKFIIPF